MGPKECKNVKILKKKPWHQLSTWVFFILIQILQNQCIFSVFLIKLTKFGCLLCLNGGSDRPEH